MANPLLQAWNKFERTLPNPAPKGEDELTRFLWDLSKRGEIGKFEEADWIDMGKKLGLTPEETNELIRQSASFLGEGPRGRRPAAWVTSSGGSRRNPDEVTCGSCGLSWDDSVSTSWTPAPAGRCPFEYFHKYRRGKPIKLKPSDVPEDFEVQPLEARSPRTVGGVACKCQTQYPDHTCDACGGCSDCCIC